MPKFESSLVSKNIPNYNLKQLEIPDESQYEDQDLEQNENFNDGAISNPQYQQIHKMHQQSQKHVQNEDLERQIRQARHDKIHGKVRITDGAKKRLEILIGMTKTSREVTIDNQLFVLESIKGKDMREAMRLSSEYENTIQYIYELRKQLLARTLKVIAGVEFEQLIGSSSLEDKFKFIEELDEELLNRLYVEYTILVKESKDKFAVKSEAEAKEVLEDLKK